MAELQEIGRRGQEELAKVIPSFVRRADVTHRSHHGYLHFQDAMLTQQRLLAERHLPPFESSETRLVFAYWRITPILLPGGCCLLYAHSNKGLLELTNYCRQLPEEELARIFDAVVARGKTGVISPQELSNMLSLPSKF